MRRNNICRLCLKKTKNLINIFDENDIQEQNDISRCIYSFFAVDIKINDPFSTYVCKTCFNCLIIIIKYRLKFRQNDNFLRKNKEKLFSTNNQKQSSTKKQIIPELCHYSVKKIFSRNKKLILPSEYWNINFDVKVNLANSKIPDDDRDIEKNELVLKQLRKMKEIDKNRRPKRAVKRTKVYGNPFSLLDDEDSDTDPLFSLLKMDF